MCRAWLPVALLFAAGAEAQVRQEPLVKISVDLIQIDAAVTDSHGKHVSGLTREDFEIYENGKRRPIASFGWVGEKSGGTEPEQGKLRREDVQRTIAIVVDDLGISFGNMVWTRDALKDFIQKRIQPGDLVAILRTSGGMGALQQFTTDKRLLLAAAERLRHPVFGRVGISSFQPLTNDRPTNNSNIGERATAARADSDEAMRQAQEEVFTAGTLGALSLTIRSLRDLPGRKSVVLISENFPFLGGTLHFQSRMLNALQVMTDLANRSSVVIYALDPKGLFHASMTAEDDATGAATAPVYNLMNRLNSRQDAALTTMMSLAFLAHETGGLYLSNNNNITGLLGRAIDDQAGFYLIGYKPDSETFGRDQGKARFRKLEVKLLKPGLRLRYRRGFLGITDEEAKPVKAAAVVAALFSPFGSQEVGVRLTPVFRHDEAEGGSFLTVLLHIKADDLTFTEQPDGRKRALLRTLIATFNEQGDVVGQTHKQTEILVKPEEMAPFLRTGIVFGMNHPLKEPGYYQMRTAVEDLSSGRIGSASQFVEAPEVKPGRLSLSGVLLSSRRPEAPDDPVSGPAVRQFRAGSQVRFEVEVMNPRIDGVSKKPSLEVQFLLYRDGDEIFSSQPYAYQAPDRPDYQHLRIAGQFGLGAMMETGEYTFELRVTDKLTRKGAAPVAQQMDFEVM